MPWPARVEASEVNFVFQTKGDYVRLQQAAFTLSEFQPGTISAEQVTIRQPWLSRTFRGASGTTAVQDARVVLANVSLEPGVEIRTLTAALDELARGRLNLNMQLTAFGGTMRGEAQTITREGRLNFEASGTFSRIQVAQLATVLSLSEPAGGMINEGRFSFRGSPRNLTKATASLRLDASKFSMGNPPVGFTHPRGDPYGAAFAGAGAGAEPGAQCAQPHR
jgi:hypothetical protein